MGLLNNSKIMLAEYIMNSMAIRVIEFSYGGYNVERFLPKNQHIQRKLLNFEFWIKGELSKSAKI